jgi:hypothetical protein
LVVAAEEVAEGLLLELEDLLLDGGLLVGEEGSGVEGLLVLLLVLLLGRGGGLVDMGGGLLGGLLLEAFGGYFDG